MTSAGKAITDVEEILQESYADMGKELNIKAIADDLFSANFITHELMLKIREEPAIGIGGNGLFLDHLIANGTVETVTRFSGLLQETGQSKCLPRHTHWSAKLKQRLDEYAEGSQATCLQRPTLTPEFASRSTEDNSPSDAALQRVLQEMGGYWRDVAILLGVPAQYVGPEDSSPLTAFLHWRNSSSKSLLPPTWKSLFDTVHSTPQLGPRMAEHLKAFATEKTGDLDMFKEIQVCECVSESEQVKTHIQESNEEHKGRIKALEEENARLKIEVFFLKHFPSMEGLIIGEGIGKGDFEHVYKGTYNSTPVAVKKIHDISIDNVRENCFGCFEMQLQEFKQQCDLLKTLRSPQVAKCMEVLYAPNQLGGLVLVMEMLDQTLTKFLEVHRDKIWRERQINICQQVASGLRYLHHHNPQLLHSKLTPSNILLDKNGRTSKIISNLQVSFKPLGLQHLADRHGHIAPYLPPEYLRDEDPQFDAKGDVFSLGVVMLEIATQLPPSCGLEGIGVVAEVERRAEDLSKVPDNHPLKSLIKQCLKDDPKERPTSEDMHLELLHPGAGKLHAEQRKDGSKIFQSGALLQGKSLQSTQLPDLPIPVCHASAVMIGCVLFVCGGFCGHHNVEAARLVQVYNTTTAKWTKLPPSPIYWSESTLLKGELTLLGGRDAMEEGLYFTNKVFSWDRDRKEWLPLPPMPTSRHRPCILHCHNLMLVCGGEGSGPKSPLDSIDVFNMDTSQWSTSAALKLPIPLWDMRASVDHEYVYITSGALTTTTTTREAYKIALKDLFSAVTREQIGEWTKVQDTPYSLSGLVASSNHPIVVGGCDESYKSTSEISVYNPSTRKWSIVKGSECMRSHFDSCCIAVSVSAFIAVGGRANLDHPTASFLSTFELFYV